MNDKLKHFLAGLAIAAIVTLLTGSLGFAGAAVLLAAAGKEMWDAFHPEHHQMDWWDIAATLAGWVPVALLLPETAGLLASLGVPEAWRFGVNPAAAVCRVIG